jgi:hypothetical protein
MSRFLSNSNIGSMINKVTKMMMDSEFARLKGNPQAALFVLFTLLSFSGRDDDYQSQLMGYGRMTKFLSQQTKNVDDILQKWNDPGTFTGTPVEAARQRALDWAKKMEALLKDMDNNPSADDIEPQVKKNIIDMLNTKGTGETKTLKELLDTGDAEGLRRSLQSMQKDKATAGGGGSTITNALTNLSKIYTDQSSAVSTRISAVSASSQQILNSWKGYTDSLLEQLRNAVSKQHVG